MGFIKMKKWCAILASSMVLGFYIWSVVFGNSFLQPSIASKVLRFHVLANSDSEEDQAVKEKVRDAVGTYLRPFLEDVENLKESKEMIERHLEKVVEISEETLRDCGYAYSVTAMLEVCDFPEKTYGEYTFPKGTYEALRIVIGEGKGQNWWCVLYPNMCFKGTVYEVIEEEAKEELREVLNPWEYAKVFDSGNVELRFKFLEFFSNNGV